MLSYTSKEEHFPDLNGITGATTNPLLLTTPEKVRPFKKANPREQRINRLKNRKRVSAILTDTPVKKALELKQKSAKKKKKKGRALKQTNL